MRRGRVVGLVGAALIASVIGAAAQQAAPFTIVPIPSTVPTMTVTGTVLTPASGTGITVDVPGQVRSLVYKVTVAAAAFTCAAVTCDLTIATAPAKTLITGYLGDLTVVFACASVCTTSTLSLTAGTSAGDAGFLVSFDADAAIGLFGDVDAELGVRINRANANEGGYLTSFSATTALTIRLTSGTGNIGTGAATNLSTGSITFYLTATVYP